MEGMWRVLSPMQWTSAGMASKHFGLLLVALAFWMGALRGIFAQEAEAIFRLEGLENRPYRTSVFHPLTQTYTVYREGQVGMDGTLKLTWPDDGRVHLMDLECAGAIWSLPVCGAYREGAALEVPSQGGAPFAVRPGGVMWSGSNAQKWTPILVAEAEAIKGGFESDMAADVQRSFLWGGAVGPNRAEASAVLGAPNNGECDGATVPEEKAADLSYQRQAIRAAFDTLIAACAERAERDCIEAIGAALWSELQLDSAEVARRVWQEAGIPDPENVAAVMAFRQGLDRFASSGDWPEEDLLRLRSALVSGQMDSLVQATAHWWGRADEDFTAAWFLARLGDGGFGVALPRRFSAAPALPDGMTRLLEHCSGHPALGPCAERLKAKLSPAGPLPKAQRLFSAGGALVTLEEVAGSGPVAWLCIDAGAPSTVVQLQVLERMMSAPSGDRRSGPRLPRDLKWVVVDAGQDWSAFEKLVKTASIRHGGMSRVPYEMLHTGGDVRWTEAFELQALPAMRHTGPGFVPTPQTPPLPGPALMGWLSKRA